MEEIVKSIALMLVIGVPLSVLAGFMLFLFAWPEIKESWKENHMGYYHKKRRF